MKEASYVAIEGVIGVGKTSLARILSETFGAHLLLEKVEENPFLKDFYKDRKRYAFQTQMFFLFSRYQQQREYAQRNVFYQRTVSDYIFQKDRIFANMNLSDQELALYERVAPILEEGIPNPDLVIYLQASTDILMERIHKRGRTFEHEITRDYIEALNDAYNYYFFHYTETPLLVVATSEIDFVANPKHLADLVARIQGHESGTTYYTPAGIL
ncbi:MAG: deoxynucleoside kinase [Candidatus Eisenbacteria bacterium]|nr:deoxynucleoside kinase [Candidatus Eisenbacteria bacterium]